MARREQLDMQKIARAAFDVVDRGLMERPTARSVARELEVAVGSIYNFYPSIDVLDTAAGHLAARQLLDSIPVRPAFLRKRSRRDIEAAASRFAFHYLRFATERPALYRLITPVDGPDLHVRGPRGDCRLWRTVERLVSSFTGKETDSPSALAFWALLHGYATLECPYAQLRTPVEAVPSGVAALLRGLAAADA